MSDAVLKKFLELKGVIEPGTKGSSLGSFTSLPPTKKETATKDKKNSEYINQNIKISMINKLIEAKPKEKYIVQYFRERLAELDEVELDD